MLLTITNSKAQATDLGYLLLSALSKTNFLFPAENQLKGGPFREDCEYHAPDLKLRREIR